MIAQSPYSKESVKRSFLHFLVGRGVAGLAGFVTVILMARYMDIKSYAGFTALTGLIAFAGILSSLGIERVVARYLPEARLEKSPQQIVQLIWTLAVVRLLASALMCGCLYLAWPLLMQWFKDVELTHFPIALACFVIAESLFQYFSAVYQSLAQQKSLTQIMVIQWAGRLLLLWIALYADHHLSLDEALWMMALPEMLSIIALIWVQRWHIKHIPEHPSHTATLWPNWQAMRHMALHNYGFTLLAAPPQGYFVKMLAAIFLPTHMVAAYGFFVSLAEKARQYIPLHFFYNLIEPVMVGNYLQHKDFNKLTQYCQWLYKSNLLILVPTIVWIAVAGSHLVDLLTAGKYHSYVWILLLVMVQLTIGSHVVLLQLILNAINKSAWLMRAGVFALFGLLLFWFVAVPMHATALLFGPLLFSLICNIYIIRKLNHSGYVYGLTWQVFTGVLAAGLAALVVALLVNQQWFTEYSNDIWVTALAGLVVLSVYLLAVYVLKLISQEEWLFLKSFKQKKTV